eukprot:CAMPEP_0171057642 /NCGR_PEP_ID=MMETSP0766_2-20121228/1961_1 /TAXON_ID=439317 /ORGANISM="Gambierdiscus australes, Strain CAWD 149" /LENGTH=165 /DNA_ID=CAMNT_0011512813 /DNA_START=103 /DNA_END=601 /DNA_ORIENTATION=-
MLSLQQLHSVSITVPPSQSRTPLPYFFVPLSFADCPVTRVRCQGLRGLALHLWPCGGKARYSGVALQASTDSWRFSLRRRQASSEASGGLRAPEAAGAPSEQSPALGRFPAGACCTCCPVRFKQRHPGSAWSDITEPLLSAKFRFPPTVAPLSSIDATLASLFQM